jgi:hypothetical protein
MRRSTDPSFESHRKCEQDSPNGQYRVQRWRRMMWPRWETENQSKRAAGAFSRSTSQPVPNAEPSAAPSGRDGVPTGSTIRKRMSRRRSLSTALPALTRSSATADASSQRRVRLCLLLRHGGHPRRQHKAGCGVPRGADSRGRCVCRARRARLVQSSARAARHQSSPNDQDAGTQERCGT